MLEPGQVPLFDALLEEIVTSTSAGEEQALLLVRSAASRRARALGNRDLDADLAAWWEASTADAELADAEIAETKLAEDLRARASGAGLIATAIEVGDGAPLGWIVSRQEVSDGIRKLLLRALELGRWLRGERRHLAALVETRAAEVERTRHELQGVDPETGLANRPDFDRTFDREWRRAARLRRPLTLVFIEIAGAVTRQLAGRIATVPSRATDLVARYDERTIAILLPDTDSNDAEILGRRLLEAMSDATLHLGIGGVTPRVGFLESRDLVKIAREALEAALRDPEAHLVIRAIDDVDVMTGSRPAARGSDVN